MPVTLIQQKLLFQKLKQTVPNVYISQQDLFFPRESWSFVESSISNS